MKLFSIKIAAATLLLIIFSTSTLFLWAGTSFADPQPLEQAENSTTSSSSNTNQDQCADTTGSDGKVDQTKVQNCLDQSPVVQRIQQIVDFLSAGVGIIVTGVILVGGIQYIMAGGNPNALTAARQRITNGVIALFAFLFIFAFLNWLIPGGIFK